MDQSISLSVTEVDRQDVKIEKGWMSRDKGQSMNKMSKKGSEWFENDCERELNTFSLSHLLMVPGQNYRRSGRVNESVIVQKILSASKVQFMIEVVLSPQQRYVLIKDCFLYLQFH